MRETLPREEGAGGLGWQHPGRPPGLMQENLTVGKFAASQAGAQPDPNPRRVLEVTSQLTSAPPASAGQLVMDASWPGLCFIFSLRSQKEEAARGQHRGRGWNLTQRLDIDNNMVALGSRL